MNNFKLFAIAGLFLGALFAAAPASAACVMTGGSVQVTDDPNCFRGGKMHGQWQLNFANGQKNRGTFVNGRKTGQWRLQFANGTVEEGRLENGVKQGAWTIRFADGAVHSGPYTNGKQRGEWTIRHSDGTVTKGKYDADGFKTGLWTHTFADGERKLECYGKGNLTFMGGDCAPKKALYSAVSVSSIPGDGGKPAIGYGVGYKTRQQAQDAARAECGSASRSLCTGSGSIIYGPVCVSFAKGAAVGGGVDLGWGSSALFSSSEQWEQGGAGHSGQSIIQKPFPEAQHRSAAATNAKQNCVNCKIERTVCIAYDGTPQRGKIVGANAGEEATAEAETAEEEKAEPSAWDEIGEEIAADEKRSAWDDIGAELGDAGGGESAWGDVAEELERTAGGGSTWGDVGSEVDRTAAKVAEWRVQQAFDKGMAAYRNGDEDGALQWWEPLAEDGHAEARRMAGVVYAERERRRQERIAREKREREERLAQEKRDRERKERLAQEKREREAEKIAAAKRKRDRENSGGGGGGGWFDTVMQGLGMAAEVYVQSQSGSGGGSIGGGSSGGSSSIPDEDYEPPPPPRPCINAPKPICYDNGNWVCAEDAQDPFYDVWWPANKDKVDHDDIRGCFMWKR